MVAWWVLSQPQPTTKSPSPPPTRGLFYGWWILALCFAFQLFSSGVFFSIFSAILKPLAETLGVTRAEVAFAPSLQLLLGLGLGIWIGDQVSKRSARWMTVAGLSAAIVGLIALSRVNSLIGLYLIYGVLFAFGSMAVEISSNALLTNWFVRRRGLVIGILAASMATAGGVAGPVMVRLMDKFGWELACLCLTIPFLLLVPLAARLLVDRPEDRNVLPDGEPPAFGTQAPASGDDWTFGAALRQKQLWVLVITFSCIVPGTLTGYMITYPYMTDLGFSDTAASAVFPALAISAGVSGPMFGHFGDRFSVRRLFLTSIILQALGIFGILHAGELHEFLIAATVFGLGAGTVGVLEKLTIGVSFGRRSFGRVLGLFNLLVAPATAFSPPLINAIFDWTGSYRLGFWLVLSTYGLALVSLTFLRVPGQHRSES